MPGAVGPRRFTDGRSTGWFLDAGLYALSAAFAAATATLAAIPLQREWGRIALPTYLVATSLAIVAGAVARSGQRQRVVLAIAVFAGAAVAPMIIAVGARAATHPSTHAQSEVIVIEEGAHALFRGDDPYRVEYLRGPLAGRPRATKTHVPYMPGMLVFGIPRALGGHEAWTDARVWFLGVSLVVGIAAIRRMRASPGGRLRTFQVMFALPTGAALVATGGDDVPVLALMLLSVVLTDRDRAGAGGVAAGLALGLKQISVLFVPFMVALARGTARRRSLAAAALTAAAITLPFAVWDLPAFVEDAVAFPLGLGDGISAAKSPTLGSLIAGEGSGARLLAAALMATIVLGLGYVLLVRRPPHDVSGASARAATVLAVAMLFAPSTRAGLLVYPANLLVWAMALRTVERQPTSDHVPQRSLPSSLDSPRTLRVRLRTMFERAFNLVSTS